MPMLQVELRPRCGFCGKELKTLRQISAPNVHGLERSKGLITAHCCSECGAVLGVTKE